MVNCLLLNHWLTPPQTMIEQMSVFYYFGVLHYLNQQRIKRYLLNSVF